MKLEGKFESISIGLVGVLVLLVVANQAQISSISGSTTGSSIGLGSGLRLGRGTADLASVDINEIRSTAQGIATLFPVEKLSTAEGAMQAMFPTGTPEYGDAMGVTFDDPIGALTKLSNAYPALDQQARGNPEVWKRYINLASEPGGVSCEFCCGVGAAGISKDGRSLCGCQHAPALLSVTLWLLMNTDYNDAQILQEVYRWKTLFFPRNMIELAGKVAGGDSSVLNDLPGMVGGC